MKVTPWLIPMALSFQVAAQNLPPSTAGSVSPGATYPGCEAPASSYKRVITLDAGQGNTLQAFFNAKKALPGDHLILKGNHGSFTITKYSQPAFANSTEWVWLDGQGATFSMLDIRDAKRFLVTGLTVSGGVNGKLVALAGAGNVSLLQNKIQGTADSSAWDIDE